MQVAELIGTVLDGRVLLAAPEWQKNQGKSKVNYIVSEYCKCDTYGESCIM